jgi:hypothetical protein
MTGNVPFPIVPKAPAGLYDLDVGTDDLLSPPRLPDPPSPATVKPKTDVFSEGTPPAALPGTPFPPPESGPPGAYYRKVISNPSADLLGISTAGVLPTPTFDPARQTPSGPLDIPDVYLGGTSASGEEVDCGLSWERVVASPGHPLFTDLPSGTDGGDAAHQFQQVGKQWVDGAGHPVPANDPRIAQMKPDFAYHPYWRVTPSAQKSLAGNRDASDTHYTYLYPGQSFTMAFQVGADGKAALTVDSSHGVSFAVHFDAQGFAGQARSFKRAISIDQVGGEARRKVAPTASTLTQGGWSSVMLKKVLGDPVPLTPAQGHAVAGSDTRPQFESIYKVSSNSPNGGELLDILPPHS